jgi:carboxyl-terminal processing protease
LSRTFRVLAAALAVSIASLGGALFLAHERTGHAEMLGDANSGIASIDLHELLANPQGGDQRMLDDAFQRVQHTYYKPFNAQTLLTGEQKELVAYLKSHKIADPAIPVLYATGDEEKDLRALNRDLSVAQSLYGKKTSDTELTQAAIRGMLNSLGDPYTTYLAPAEINALEESLKGGDFGGIGVYIEQDRRTGAIVVAPIEGTPAYKAGVHIGDRVLAVGGQPVAKMRLDDVSGLIRGRVGTAVDIKIMPLGSHVPKTFSIVRQQIVVPSVHAKMEDGFEYVRLADFGSTSYDEVRKAMLDGKAHNAKGYIFDLRNNGGGLLEAAVEISSLFIPDGTIVSTIDRAGDREIKTALHTSIGTAPLVLLVNQYTASASEITAGAVQDYRVGTLIGNKTFGKGVVQSIYNTPDGGALKITTARYLTPHGRDIQHKGIEPDIVIDQAPSPANIDTPSDKQLSFAKAFLRKQLH